MDDTIYVRLASPHGIYREQGMDGGEVIDIHLFGFEPETGQVITLEDGTVTTHVWQVPRTTRLMGVLGKEKGRLIEVRDPKERAKIAAAEEALKARVAAQQAATPAVPTVTMTAEELELRLQAVRLATVAALKADGAILPPVETAPAESAKEAK